MLRPRCGVTEYPARLDAKGETCQRLITRGSSPARYAQSDVAASKRAEAFALPIRGSMLVWVETRSEDRAIESLPKEV